MKKKYVLFILIQVVIALGTKTTLLADSMNMGIVNNIEAAEQKISDMQATVRWHKGPGGSIVDYKWTYKNGMERRETSNNNNSSWNEEEKDYSAWPIEILSYDSQKQYAFTSTHDKSIQRGGVYGLNLIPFEASLMPRVLLGYSLLDSLSDRLKKAESIKCLEQADVIQGRICSIIEATDILIEKGCIQHYKVWIDQERDYRPLKIEIYRKTDPKNPWDSLSRSISNIELQQIDGIWFPISGDIQYFQEAFTLKDGRDVETLPEKEIDKIFGHLNEEQANEMMQKHNIPRGPVQHIEISGVVLNQGLTEEDFKIVFPVGCTVWDDFVQHGYKVGVTNEELLELKDNIVHSYEINEIELERKSNVVDDRVDKNSSDELLVGSTKHLDTKPIVMNNIKYVVMIIVGIIVFLLAGFLLYMKMR